jgi:hypothetical protein
LPRLRRSLDSSQTSGAAQLALIVRTHRAPLRSSNSARLTPPLVSGYLRRRTGEGKAQTKTLKSSGGKLVALPTLLIWATDFQLT